MQWLLQFFTWWNGQTLNTRFHTWRHGEFVGKDTAGNSYYRTRGGKLDAALGFERRWVIYVGESDGSATPPGWYGWLHHTSDVPPTQENYLAKDWQRPHQPNMSGTALAYRPPGSMANIGVNPEPAADYDAWSPGA
ncbi:MAG: NADH:ubiquinone oxidoreductase subunit NDUFA12 [Hyphomicrobiales bacterium]|nr:NADH:ubiquinone oxidoreductase subunit NDUFA12 [Hyphomicrobiales bacterium]MDE2114910.1 NADH:ubiquinone oxidoreductase subunit NDUFA12 [Hyphomicrobiales bacterium]